MAIRHHGSKFADTKVHYWREECCECGKIWEIERNPNLLVNGAKFPLYLTDEEWHSLLQEFRGKEPSLEAARAILKLKAQLEKLGVKA